MPRFTQNLVMDSVLRGLGALGTGSNEGYFVEVQLGGELLVANVIKPSRIDASVRAITVAGG